MASQNKTPNMQLPQWQDNEKLEMNDLNDAFQKTETEVSKKVNQSDFATHLAENDPEDPNNNIVLASGLMGKIETNDLYARNNVSALTFTDRTPFYDGDALEELSRAKGDGEGGIDHSSLPMFAQKKVINQRNKGLQSNEETGRDLGAMISILTKAVQQLIEKNKEQDAEIENILKGLNL